MKARCLLGHRYKVMPWMKTRDGSPKPDKACINCGKIRYNWVLYIHSAEGPGLGYYLPPFWEGQTPPEGFSSWKEVSEKRQEALKKMLADMRKERR